MIHSMVLTPEDFDHLAGTMRLLIAYDLLKGFLIFIINSQAR